MTKVIQNKKQVLIGSTIIVIGVLLYILDRPPLQTQFIPNQLSFYFVTPKVFGHLGYNLPSFIHVLGLSVLTAGIIARKRSVYLLICGLWGLVNISFELLQERIVIGLIYQTFGYYERFASLYQWLINYSNIAIFDARDLFAIICGAIFGYWILMLTQRREKNE